LNPGSVIYNRASLALAGILESGRPPKGWQLECISGEANKVVVEWHGTGRFMQLTISRRPKGDDSMVVSVLDGYLDESGYESTVFCREVCVSSNGDGTFAYFEGKKPKGGEPQLQLMGMIPLGGVSSDISAKLVACLGQITPFEAA